MTLYQEIFGLIRGKCVSDESAKMAAKEVAKLVEEKFTSANKQSTPCINHGKVGIRIVSTVVCADCGCQVNRIMV